MRDKITAAAFLLIIFVSSIAIHPAGIISDTVSTFLASAFSCEGEAAGSAMEGYMQSGQKEISDSLPYRAAALDMNGRFLKAAGTRTCYDGQYNINITEDGYCVGSYDRTSTDYEVEQTVAFKRFLDEKGIEFLYVNEPSKYTDDSFFTEQFGTSSYLNRNADLFLQRISDAGVDHLDLRESAEEDGIDVPSLFYRTDHHWTVPASRWAASKIAEKLNRDHGFRIDMDLYSPGNFTEKLYRDAWCGEQGAKVSAAYLGMDDYTLIEPVYSTSYRLRGLDGEPVARGSFSSLIDKERFSSPGTPCTPSWHYAYWGSPGMIRNDGAKRGNVLVLGDSYEISMIPFLSLGIRDITLVVPRDEDVDIRALIGSGKYDTVIAAYAQFMIGAHDDPDNANYSMFTLE